MYVYTYIYIYIYQDCIAHKGPLEQPSRNAEQEKISIQSSHSHCKEMQIPKAQSPFFETSAKLARKTTGLPDANFHQESGFPVSEKDLVIRAEVTRVCGSGKATAIWSFWALQTQQPAS